jgi:hypothetical protein
LENADLFVLEGTSNRNITDFHVIEGGFSIVPGAPLILPLTFSGVVIMQRKFGFVTSELEMQIQIGGEAYPFWETPYLG